MADIFISYAREDAAAARRLAAELETRGWSVFWDRRIPAGRRFSDYIGEQLRAAKCVITLWSQAANASDWVQEEAEEAKKRNVLVPALIEPVEAPLGFRRIQAADLVDWRGESGHEGFRQLLQDIEQYVPAPTPAVREKGSVKPETETLEPAPLESGSAGAPSTEKAIKPSPGSADVPPETVALPGTIEERRSDVAPPPPRRPPWWVAVLALPVLAFVGWLLVREEQPPPAEQRPIQAQLPVENQPPTEVSRGVRTNPRDRQIYVRIPPGEFSMGCSPGDSECDSDERQARAVTITKGFWMGQTEVTQAAYSKVIGSNPSHFNGEKLPVEHVTWVEAASYCEAVGGRLPTEAEWEYAARGGTTAARYGELDAIAWYSQNSGGRTHDVKGKQANAFGLYDMLGNVWEWTADWYGPYQGAVTVDPKGPSSGDRRVLRGGSWDSYSRYARASLRNRLGERYRGDGVGFRCAGEFP